MRKREILLTSKSRYFVVCLLSNLSKLILIHNLENEKKKYHINVSQSLLFILLSLLDYTEGLI